jgi:signal transduction histidine kinase/ActR/RegA family two-component response regulator
MNSSSSDFPKQDPESVDWLTIAQAEYLRSNLYVANIGTSSVIIFLGYFFWTDNLSTSLILWLSIGLSGTLFRTVLMFVYRQPDCFQDKPKIAKRYLYLYTAGTILSGIAFGFGWFNLMPHFSSYEQLIYLLSIVALLFGGLFAYSPYFPAYIGFSSTALWLSPLILDIKSETYITGLIFGTCLISLVSTMFAYRFSGTFKANKGLQLNVFRLLSEVTRKRDEAVSANVAKSTFLASVSHDLRQPMQAISLTLNTLQQLILRRVGGEKTQVLIEENLAGLQHSVQYLNAMFEALVSVSRLDAGAIQINIQYQTIEALFKSLEYEYSKVAAQENLEFEIAVPDRFVDYAVKVDIHLLERLLRNLITNALRYTTKGGVRLSARIKGNMLDIRVSDTGLGIPIAMRSKVFDEFVQIRNPLAKEKNIGMGLGLSIAKRLCGLLNTRIRLHTHEGIGSVFAFKLPFKKIVSPHYAVLDVNATVASEHLIHGKLIVVIDDDPNICAATKTMLELYGAEVIVAESGDSAIQSMIFTSRLPNLILSDFRLIGETGLECIEKIRNEFNDDIPALIITGDTAPQEVNLLKTSGVEVLYKPVPADVLLLAVKRQIINHR